MKLLKDLTIEVKKHYTIITRGALQQIIEPARTGYYDAGTDAIKQFENAKNETTGFLVEDASFDDHHNHIEYRIIIKNTANHYVLSDEYSSSTAYAEAMLDYYKKIIENPRWVAFSTIKSFFAYGDGKRTVKITDEGGAVDYGTDVGPLHYLVSEHFNKPPMKIPPNVAGDTVNGDCILLHPHPLETGKLCEKDGQYRLSRKDQYGEIHCLYDGHRNYVCTDSEGKTEDVFERLSKDYDLFWVGGGENLVVKKYRDYHLAITKNFGDIDQYIKTLDEIKYLSDLDNALYTVFHEGIVYIAYPFGVVSWDGATALYTLSIIDDLYDAMKTIMNGRFAPATDPEEAYLKIYEKIV